MNMHTGLLPAQLLATVLLSASSPKLLDGLVVEKEEWILTRDTEP